MEFDATVIQERFRAIKPGSIHSFLHLKMPVLSQEYDINQFSDNKKLR